MKLHTTSRILMMILLMGGSMSTAIASNAILTDATTHNDIPRQDWTLVQETNGVQVFLTIVTIDNERFLSIQLKNTTSERVDLICSVAKNNTTIRITPDEMTEARIQLDANGTQEIDGSYTIYLSDEDQIADFTISLIENKR